MSDPLVQKRCGEALELMKSAWQRADSLARGRAQREPWCWRTHTSTPIITWQQLISLMEARVSRTTFSAETEIQKWARSVTKFCWEKPVLKLTLSITETVNFYLDMVKLWEIIQNRAMSHGYNLLIFQVQGGPNTVNRVIRWVENKNQAGALP